MQKRAVSHLIYVVLTVLFGIPGMPLRAWQDPTELKVYTEHPRLFLRPQRLRLLKRETQRQSLRWEQFQTLIGGKAALPEPGFALALYYSAGDDVAIGRQAVAWALDPKNSDLRQMALVFDWCQELLPEKQKADLAAKLRNDLAGRKSPASLSEARDLLLAAIAVADEAPAESKATIEAVMLHFWPDRIVKPLSSGKIPIQRAESYALMELLHAARDNFNSDLRETAPKWFKPLPLEWLLTYYPMPFPGAENEYHISASEDPVRNGTPDLAVAALTRAADLAMIAFDANAPETQVLQGWSMNDRFLLRGTFGIAYEFLWANPYQPGLSYFHVPLALRDDTSGALYMRSSWDDDARWLGYFGGQLQLFDAGKITVMNPESARGPLDLEEGIVFFGKAERRFVTQPAKDPEKKTEDVFIVGLKPRTMYRIETDDEELDEAESDVGGTLYFARTRAGVTIRLSEAGQ